MIKIDLRSSQPIYEQIISEYKKMILKGYLKSGDPIPSVRKLAVDMKITPGTVAKAYRELEAQGIIETIRGKGTYIAESKSAFKPDEGMLKKVEKDLKEQCMELIYQGLGKKEILKIVENILEEFDGKESKTNE